MVGVGALRVAAIFSCTSLAVLVAATAADTVASILTACSTAVDAPLEQAIRIIPMNTASNTACFIFP